MFGYRIFKIPQKQTVDLYLIQNATNDELWFYFTKLILNAIKSLLYIQTAPARNKILLLCEIIHYRLPFLGLGIKLVRATSSGYFTINLT